MPSRVNPVRLGTGSAVAGRIGVTNGTVYSWLPGEFRPANPKLISAFLASTPIESGSGIAPTGYQYREYKNWRGIPKPRLPVLQASQSQDPKGSERLSRRLHGWRSDRTRRNSHDEALRAWNGKS